MSKKRRKKKKINLNEALSNIERQEKTTENEDTEKENEVVHNEKENKVEDKDNLQIKNIKKDIGKIFLATFVTIALLLVVVYLANTTSLVNNFAQNLSNSLHIEI